MKKLKISPFSQKVYDLISTVPAGKVTTYKLIAEKMNTKAYQAVGQALRCNPFAPKVPCHRVVTNNGKIGGFMGKTSGKELEKKVRMLKEEGIIFRDGKIVNFKEKRWEF